MPEGGELIGPIDDSRFVERTRQRFEESGEDEDSERQTVGSVDEHQSGPRVEQAESAQLEEQRHHRQLRGNRQPGEEQAAQHRPIPPLSA